MKQLSFLALFLLAGCATHQESWWCEYNHSKETGICFVHKKPMRRETVPILYGRLDLKEGELQARRKYPFPGEYFGDPAMTDKVATEQETWVCDKCHRDLRNY